jgi:hypothetical protein
MKSFAVSTALCLCLIAAAAWLVATPVHAGTLTVDCADGTTRTCSGMECIGQDDDEWLHTVRGYCHCATSGGSYDIKQCPSRDPDEWDDDDGGISPVRP